MRRSMEVWKDLVVIAGLFLIFLLSCYLSERAAARASRAPDVPPAATAPARGLEEGH